MSKKALAKPRKAPQSDATPPQAPTATPTLEQRLEASERTNVELAKLLGGVCVDLLAIRDAIMRRMSQ